MSDLQISLLLIIFKNNIIMKCPKCKRDNQEGASFCSHCGAPLSSEKVCDNCHKSNPVDASFCKHCGNSLTGGGKHKSKPSRTKADLMVLCVFTFLFSSIFLYHMINWFAYEVREDTIKMDITTGQVFEEGKVCFYVVSDTPLRLYRGVATVSRGETKEYAIQSYHKSINVASIIFGLITIIFLMLLVNKWKKHKEERAST